MLTPLVPRATLAAAAILLSGCPALGDHNPTSHAIWWISGAMFSLLLLFLAIELFDLCRFAWRRLRGLDPPSSPAADEIFLIREDRRRLRQRHGWRARPVRRTWGEGKTAADPESER